MEVEIRLRRVLVEHKLDHHGIIGEIAEDVDLDRRVISKYYTGKAPTYSPDVLGRLCDWLGRKGVPVDELPGLLLGAKASELWPTVAAKKRVHLYLGAYHHLREPAPARRSVSSSDTAVATDLIARVTKTAAKMDFHPEILLHYTPLRFPLTEPDLGAQPLVHDIVVAARAFNEMKNHTAAASSFLIGSQRVNYLLECFVADLCGCKPFQMPKQRKVPFFLVYKKTDHKPPSCFGGVQNPFFAGQRSVPGLHYVQKGGRWRACPWDKDRSDAGVVIVTHNEHTRAVEIAVFGFSGRATEALGKELMLRGKDYWPPQVETRTKKIGIYICLLEFKGKNASAKQALHDTHACKCRVIPLDERVLKNHLA